MGGIAAVIVFELVAGLALATPLGAWYHKHVQAREAPSKPLKGGLGSRVSAFFARYPSIGNAWVISWAVIHLIFAVGIAGLATWLGIEYAPVMEPQYIPLLVDVAALAGVLGCIYTKSALTVFRAFARTRQKPGATRPHLGTGTMAPIAIAVIVVAAIFIYPQPGYYLEKWRLDTENAAFGVIYDMYGGWQNPPGGSGLDTLNATGWFHIEKVNGRFWLVDPIGKPFVSKGVNFISYNSDAIKGTSIHPYKETNDAKYGSQEAWGNTTLLRMGSWHFNTAGAWCDWFNIYLAPHHRKPYTVILNIADQAGADWLTGSVADVWGDAFVNGTLNVVANGVFFFKNDPYCIGYFLDNELNWGSKDWRSDKTLLELYLSMSSNATGRGVLLAFLEDSFDGNIASFNAAFGTAVSSWSEVAGLGKEDISFETQRSRDVAEVFRHEVAMQYFTVCHAALRAEAPHQLNLGCRFAADPLESVTSAAKGLVDVISFAGYSSRPPLDRFERVFRNNDVPIIIEEFAFKAADSGLPNTRGAGPVVLSQHQRALLYAQYIQEFMSRPYAVGYHWFQWADQPAEGRFDGENSNFGLVTIKDEPYTLLVEMAASTNLRAETLHAGL
ncbi:MAG: hypothetical protein Q6370_013865 [Candidatus Sigynarchaeota archaeon]